MVNKWLNYVRFCLFSGSCWLCDAETHSPSGLCTPCRNDLAFNRTACPICSQPLPPFPSQPQIQTQPQPAMRCGQCLDAPPQYDASFVPFIYAPPITQFVSRFKFDNQLAYGRILAHLFCEALTEIRTGTRYYAENMSATQAPQCLIPVPLHRKRLAERGYNQALELARFMSKTLDIDLDHKLCRRARPTRAQSELTLQERHKNTRKAFTVNGVSPYQHVAIVDDVVTSGSTVNELARVLKSAGVETVQVWAIARAVVHR